MKYYDCTTCKKTLNDCKKAYMCETCYFFRCVPCYGKVKQSKLKDDQISIVLSNIYITTPMLVNKNDIPSVKSN